jgi:hypothetical protein
MPPRCRYTNPSRRACPPSTALVAFLQTTAVPLHQYPWEAHLPLLLLLGDLFTMTLVAPHHTAGLRLDLDPSTRSLRQFNTVPVVPAARSTAQTDLRLSSVVLYNKKQRAAGPQKLEELCSTCPFPPVSAARLQCPLPGCLRLVLVDCLKVNSPFLT